MISHAESTRPKSQFPAWSEISRIADLVLCLAWRDLRVRYSQSVLGIAWAIVQPVCLTFVFAFILGPSLGRTLPDGLPYALFVFAGLVPWSFFSGALTQCTNSLVANRNLVTKLYFPREAFPFSCVAAALVDFFIGLLALGGLIAFYGVQGTWVWSWDPSILFLPAVLIVQTMLMAGLGLTLAMGHLFYRDVRQIVGIALQLGLFISAVVVPVPAGTSWIAQIISWNPMVAIIGAYRDCLLFGRFPDPVGLSYAAIVAFVMLIGGWIAFRRASFRFAECI